MITGLNEGKESPDSYNKLTKETPAMQTLAYLHIVVSNTYCVPYVASFSGLSIFDCPIRYSLMFK
jgi:uncharacterized membrane protein